MQRAGGRLRAYNSREALTVSGLTPSIALSSSETVDWKRNVRSIRPKSVLLPSSIRVSTKHHRKPAQSIAEAPPQIQAQEAQEGHASSWRVGGSMNPWFRFYHEALDDPKVQKLTTELFRDWVNILCLTCRNDGFLPGLVAVSFALRKSETDTTKTLDDLMSIGLIDRLKSGRLRPHNWDSRQFKSDNSYERVKRFRNVSRNGLKRRNETAPDTEQIQTPIVPVNGDGVVERFEAVWKAYPRKVGKAAALKVWVRIRPSSELTTKMLAQIEVSRFTEQWKKNNGQFIPHPATWLHQGRWDDEPVTVTSERKAVY